MKRTRQLLTSPTFLFTLALVLRLTYLAIGIMHRRTIPSGLIPIGNETGRIGLHIAEGLGYSSPLKYDTGPTAWITPIYPYLIAGLFKIFGLATIPSDIAIKIVNNIFSALVCIPLFAMGRRLFGVAIGAAAAWLWIFYYPAYYWPSAWIWDTSLSALAMTLILWATYALDDTDNAVHWGGYGALWAFGTLVNASVLATFPGLFAYAAYRARKRGAPWIRLGTVAALALALGIAPWVIRNEAVFHGKVFLRSNFGLELWLGNNPQVPDTWTWWLHPNDNQQEGMRFARMGEVAYMQEKEHLAIDFIKSHPTDVARFEFHRFIMNWTGTDDPIADVWAKLPFWAQAMLVVNCSFSLLAWIGLICARRTEPLQYLPLLNLLALFPAVYYITHNTPRYRHPIDPAMALLVVYAVAQAMQWLREKQTKRAPSEIPVGAVS